MHDGAGEADTGLEPDAGSDHVRAWRAQLGAVEEQPLVERAARFGALHQALLRELESGDAPRDA